MTAKPEFNPAVYIEQVDDPSLGTYIRVWEIEPPLFDGSEFVIDEDEWRSDLTVRRIKSWHHPTS